MKIFIYTTHMKVAGYCLKNSLLYLLVHLTLLLNSEQGRAIFYTVHMQWRWVSIHNVGLCEWAQFAECRMLLDPRPCFVNVHVYLISHLCDTEIVMLVKSMFMSV